MLSRYFRERNLLQEVTWKDLTETKIDPLYVAWCALDEQSRQKSLGDFQEIQRLADEGGKLAMLDEADHHGERDRLSKAFADYGFLDCAFWAFFECPKIWEGALRFADADNKPRRNWRKRRNMPARKDPITEADGDALAKELSKLLFRQQARGKNCKVELYRRGKREYFFAYPEDHRQTGIEWEKGEFERRTYTPAFEIIFVYDTVERSLNIWYRGEYRLGQDLQVIFAQSVLGTEIERESRRDTRVYDLEPLKDRDFNFNFGPELGIESVFVRKLRLDVWGETRRRITLEANPADPPSAIHDLMEAVTAVLSRSRVFISQVGLHVIFMTPPDAKRSPTRRFDINYPNSCSLQNEGRDFFIQQMLSQSGIEPQTPKEEETDDNTS